MKRVLRVIIILLIIIAAYVVQTGIFPFLSLGGIKPNLLLIVTAAFGYFLGEKGGMLVGLACGILWDIFSGPLLGLEMIILTLAGYLCGKFQRLLYVEDLAFPAVMICVSDLLFGLANYLILFLFRGRLNLPSWFRLVMVPEMLYTVLVSVPLFALLRLLYDRWLRIRPSQGTNGTDLSQY